MWIVTIAVLSDTDKSELSLHFIHNEQITEKSLTIEDDCIPAYKALAALREQLLSDY